MQKITPFLWFDKEAREAAEFYVSVFGGDSKIKNIQTFLNAPVADTETEIVDVSLRGQDFTLMSAGPYFKINEAISFAIDCKDQEEADYFTNKMSAVPEAEQCGWIKDKFGVSWQIVPRRLVELQNDPDKEKAGRVVRAMLQMKRINVAELEKAAEG